jgi:magnesium transporter
MESIPDNNTRLVVASLEEEVFINNICTSLDIHHLIVEDIFTNSQLPKFEIFDEYYFLVLKYLEFDSEEDVFQIRQISLILKNNNVIALIEGRKNPAIEEVKMRLRESIGNLRTQKSDYLFYRIIDLTVDQYFSAVNYIRTKVDDLEDLTVEGRSTNISNEIIDIKRQINHIRRISVPLREEIVRIKNIGPGLIRKPTLTYFQDILDHLANNISSLETFREILTDLMELHFSQLSASMNQVMKTLTVVTTIFIPLTFIAGVYGMNFHFMPEIKWKLGYLAFWLIILSITGVMMRIMKKKRWF